jgi:hypothetical protein
MLHDETKSCQKGNFIGKTIFLTEICFPLKAEGKLIIEL